MGFFIGGKLQHKSGALRSGLLHRNRAPVFLDDALTDGQPQPHTLAYPISIHLLTTLIWGEAGGQLGPEAGGAAAGRLDNGFKLLQGLGKIVVNH